MHAQVRRPPPSRLHRRPRPAHLARHRPRRDGPSGRWRLDRPARSSAHGLSSLSATMPISRGQSTQRPCSNLPSHFVTLDVHRHDFYMLAGNDPGLSRQEDGELRPGRVCEGVSGFRGPGGKAACHPERRTIAGHAARPAEQSSGSAEGRQGRAVLHSRQPAMADLLRVARGTAWT